MALNIIYSFVFSKADVIWMRFWILDGATTSEYENFCMSLCVVMGNNSIAGNGDDDSVEFGQLPKQIYVASFLRGFSFYILEI